MISTSDLADVYIDMNKYYFITLQLDVQTSMLTYVFLLQVKPKSQKDQNDQDRCKQQESHCLQGLGTPVVLSCQLCGTVSLVLRPKTHTKLPVFGQMDGNRPLCEEEKLFKGPHFSH